MGTENVYKVISETLVIGEQELVAGALVKLSDERATPIIDHLELATPEETEKFEADLAAAGGKEKVEKEAVNVDAPKSEAGAAPAGQTTEAAPADVPKEVAPQTAPAAGDSQAAAQGSGDAAATPAKPSETSEKKPGFMGGHIVGGNEPNPHKGGALRESGLKPKA